MKLAKIKFTEPYSLSSLYALTIKALNRVLKYGESIVVSGVA